jgi:ABC-type uncharacterized transport system substrate-binding protein
MIAATLVLTAMHAALPAAAHVVVVADAPGRLVDEAIAGLAKDGTVVDLRLVGEVDGLGVLVGPSVVFLAAGPKSARALASWSPSTTAPKRAAFLVKSADAPANIAAVSLDAPLAQQMAWLKSAFPGRSRVIVPRSDAHGDAEIKDAAQKAGLTLALVDVKSPGEAVPAVDDALKKSSTPSMILLVPDAVAVTPDTVAPLVQDALSLRTPVVGFSTYFLKVGAIAAVAVDAAAMAKQAIALAVSQASPAASVAVVAPESGHLVVDGRLAERLGVAVRDGAGVEVRR